WSFLPPSPSPSGEGARAAAGWGGLGDPATMSTPFFAAPPMSTLSTLSTRFFQQSRGCVAEPSPPGRRCAPTTLPVPGRENSAPDPRPPPLAPTPAPPTPSAPDQPPAPASGPRRRTPPPRPT